jgi:two-component system, NarL family, response regulator LiaR
VGLSTNFLGLKSSFSRSGAAAQRKKRSFSDFFVAPLRRRGRKCFGKHVKNRTLIHTLIYGLCGGVLIVLLKVIEVRFLMIEHSIEIYGGLIAALFAGLGIWLGLKLTKQKEVLVVKEVAVPATQSFALNQQRLKDLGITRRELEILELIAQGLSNREIADKLFVSENTVKTHSSRLFDKLSARRRTQAVQIGKEMGLIP